MITELYKAFISFMTCSESPQEEGFHNTDQVVAVWSAIALRNCMPWRARVHCY
jgi:hypothetical protein